MRNAATSSHRWRFFRAGGFNQVVLNSGADLLNLDQLDQKLWVALACPTTGVEFDKTTLALIDTDKDGRVRAPELIAAVKWAGGLLKNPDDLLKGSPTLQPAAINDANPEGKLIASFARQVLGKTDSAEVTIDEAATAAQTFAAKPFNGDGIVPADSAGDDATKAVIADIITCLGADTDASGKPGVSQAKVDQFFCRCRCLFRLVEKGRRRRVRVAAGREHRSRRRRRQGRQGQGGRLFCARPAGRFRSALRQRAEPRREGIRRVGRQRPDQQSRGHCQPAAGASRGHHAAAADPGHQSCVGRTPLPRCKPMPSCRCSAPGRC